MAADLKSDEMAKLLIILESAEQDVDDCSLFALRQLGDLHAEAKAAVTQVNPHVEGSNPIVERIAKAMVKRRSQG